MLIEPERPAWCDNDQLKRAIREKTIIMLSAHRARAKKWGAEGTCSLEEWAAIVNRFGGRCLRCGREDLLLGADHVIPMSQGGRNDPSNLQPLCESCNIAKGKTSHADYRDKPAPYAPRPHRLGYTIGALLADIHYGPRSKLQPRGHVRGRPRQNASDAGEIGEIGEE